MDDMVGKYIVHFHRDDSCYQILREKKDQNAVYEIVIPDAGYNKEFALGLVSLLNSQGSEVGVTSGSTEAN